MASFDNLQGLGPFGHLEATDFLEMEYLATGFATTVSINALFGDEACVNGLYGSDDHD